MDKDYWQARKVDLQNLMREKEVKIKEWSNEIEDLDSQIMSLTSRRDSLVDEINELKKEQKSFRDEYDSIVRNEKDEYIARKVAKEFAEQIMEKPQEFVLISVKDLDVVLSHIRGLLNLHGDEIKFDQLPIIHEICIWTNTDTKKGSTSFKFTNLKLIKGKYVLPAIKNK